MGPYKLTEPGKTGGREYATLAEAMTAWDAWREATGVSCTLHRADGTPLDAFEAGALLRHLRERRAVRDA